MTQIYFTNATTGDFTINDDELQDEAIRRLEKTMKKQALRIAANNSLERLEMASKCVVRATIGWYNSL